MFPVIWSQDFCWAAEEVNQASVSISTGTFFNADKNGRIQAEVFFPDVTGSWISVEVFLLIVNLWYL